MPTFPQHRNQGKKETAPPAAPPPPPTFGSSNTSASDSVKYSLKDFVSLVNSK